MDEVDVAGAVALGSPALQCRCSASCSLPCRQAEPCAVSGSSPAKTRAVRGATALLPGTVGLGLPQDVKQPGEGPKDP